MTEGQETLTLPYYPRNRGLIDSEVSSGVCSREKSSEKKARTGTPTRAKLAWSLLPPASPGLIVTRVPSPFPSSTTRSTPWYPIRQGHCRFPERQS